MNRLFVLSLLSLLLLSPLAAATATQAEVQIAMDQADLAIYTATNAGKDVTAASSMFEEAQRAFLVLYDYDTALAKATEAKRLADTATIPSTTPETPEPTTPAPGDTTTPDDSGTTTAPGAGTETTPADEGSDAGTTTPTYPDQQAPDYEPMPLGGEVGVNWMLIGGVLLAVFLAAVLFIGGVWFVFLRNKMY